MIIVNSVHEKVQSLNSKCRKKLKFVNAISFIYYLIGPFLTLSYCMSYVKIILVVFEIPNFSAVYKLDAFAWLQVLGADLSILDEIDSGLDVDALRDVAKAVNGLLTPKNSVLMITHYLRLLEFIKPSYIHVIVSYCGRHWIMVKRTDCVYLFVRRKH